MNTLVNQYRVVFYVESAVREEELVLGEGAGFFVDQSWRTSFNTIWPTARAKTSGIFLERPR